MIVICDIDGTLSDMEARRTLLLNDPIDWVEFSRRAFQDPPIVETVETIRALKQRTHRIIIFTGRDESARELTVKWLEQHHIPYNDLCMREEGDDRPNWQIKKEWLSKYSPSSVLVALDDDPQVIRMYRQKGVPAWLVSPDTNRQRFQAFIDQVDQRHLASLSHTNILD